MRIEMNRSRAHLISFCLLALSFSALAQQKPEADTEGAKSALIQFIELSNKQALRTPEAHPLLFNEAINWDTPSLGKLAAGPDKVILINKRFAVARLQWYGENNYVADLYFYLTFDGSWRIGAVGRLALTGIVEMAYQGLKSKKTLTKAEQDELSNLELLLAPDETLRAWFRRNIETMNKLYDLTRTMRKGDSVSLPAQDKRFPDITRILNEIHFDVVEVLEDGNVQITIGGVTDNTVGFIYSPSNNPPSIDPHSYIWVEEVATRWFLFRTT